MKKVGLFEGFKDYEIAPMLKCLSAKEHRFGKGEYVIGQSEPINDVGIVCTGKLKIQKEDREGNTLVIAEVFENEIFAEAFVCAGTEESPVSVVAETDSKVMFINYKKIINRCGNSCEFHSRLIANMLQIMAKKMIFMNQKIDVLQKKTIREKLSAYFEICAEKNSSREFLLPFNKSVLAEHIGVNRSAMVRELYKMENDGLIKISKQKITII